MNPHAENLRVQIRGCFHCAGFDERCDDCKSIESAAAEIERLEALAGTAVIKQAANIAKARQEELENTQRVLEAWMAAFGTSQLTHAIARLEQAEKECDRLRAEIEALKGNP